MKIKTINLVSIAVGLVGVYFVYDFGKKKGWFSKEKPKEEAKKTTTEGSTPEKTQPTNTGVITPTKKTPTHIVNTKSGTLNVRQATNTTSKIVGILAKGQPILASQSSTVGWHRILNDGGVVIGYVSSDYIKAV